MSVYIMSDEEYALQLERDARDAERARNWTREDDIRWMAGFVEALAKMGNRVTVMGLGGDGYQIEPKSEA